MHSRIEIVAIIFIMYSLEFRETQTANDTTIMPAPVLPPVPETTIFEKFAYLNAPCGPGQKECDEEGHLQCPKEEPKICECQDRTFVDRYDKRRCLHSQDNERKFGEDCNNLEGEQCDLREQLQCSTPQGPGTCECIFDRYVKFNTTTKKCDLNETGKYGFGGADTIYNRSVHGLVQIVSCFVVFLLLSSFSS